MNPRPSVAAAVERLTAVIAPVDEEAARAASGLPGWSRAHVMAHLANFSLAMTRQVDEARAGRLVEMYDGGRPARSAAIEADSARPAEELKDRVNAATADLLAAWAQVDDWSRPVSHRNGDLASTVFTAWREFEVHTVDLALAATSDDWSPEFCLHLLDFLRPRTPEGIRLRLEAEDVVWEEGGGQVRVVKGRLTDLTAWMAGRQPVSSLVGELPELSPWP
ncbi:maleylpyruvate isomerase [Kribbella amoyensis]|uniref:Maleylpyruvate isomerase n=1 Tax=Kribbella amoyensis TaxID=996641 RepID=A0A561B359_9ACTN|nr:maleylpyruvate isomerase family mycothiol-dependent enzyme [Kribbella amoyensis]TWD73286.1 maleylpyruvate isomerase [Kribbella amoyensis]